MLHRSSSAFSPKPQRQRVIRHQGGRAGSFLIAAYAFAYVSSAAVFVGSNTEFLHLLQRGSVRKQMSRSSAINSITKRASSLIVTSGGFHLGLSLGNARKRSRRFRRRHGERRAARAKTMCKIAGRRELTKLPRYQPDDLAFLHT